MAKKMSRRTLALSLSAITVVYLAGYVVTEPTNERLTVAEALGSSATAIDPAATPSAPSTPISPPATPTLPPTPRPTPIIPRSTNTPAVVRTGFLDGSYDGYGRSRRGDVAVTVTIKQGKITSAEITDCMTQYPQSVIDGLPAEVLARQSARIDLISGATYSSRAYQDAVLMALGKAGPGPSAAAAAGPGSAG